MFVKGDKIKSIAPIFGNNSTVGEIATITDVNYDTGLIAYEFDNFSSNGIMSINVFDNYFEKYEKSKYNGTYSVNEDRINWILENSEFNVDTVFDKCTVVSCRLPNGFVIVEYSSCVDPDNYDEDCGIDICVSKIADKIWELEGYLLQNRLYEEQIEDFDEPDCENCDDYDCEFHPSHSSDDK